MSKLTVDLIEYIRRSWDDDLYPNNAQFYALCDMALASVRDAEPVAWLCEWSDWKQYHDASDPLPSKWDDRTPTITPLYLHPTAHPSADELLREALEQLRGWNLVAMSLEAENAVTTTLIKRIDAHLTARSAT